ncbi:MAG: response regulator [Propionivibrio sp.]
MRQIRSILGKNENEAPPEIDLPSDKKNTPAAPAAPVERRSRKRINSHKGRRILIVDDSPTIVGALKKMLRSAGCITLEAPDAENGLELIRKEKPELVFLDIVLPGMTGFAALRQMRRDPLTLHIPVIMISGNEQATEQFYVKRIGADDFMKKPFSRHEVFARIENLIEEKKLKQILAADDKPAARPAPHRSPPAKASTALATSQKPKPRPTAAPARTIEPSISALEARKHLTEMGLQYFSQEQFVAAIERGDKLAVELFIASGSVDIGVRQDARHALRTRQTTRRRPRLQRAFRSDRIGLGLPRDGRERLPHLSAREPEQTVASRRRLSVHQAPAFHQ